MATVLEGTGRFTVGGEAFHLNEGETLVMPKDIPHAAYEETRFKMQLTVSFYLNPKAGRLHLEPPRFCLFRETGGSLRAERPARPGTRATLRAPNGGQQQSRSVSGRLPPRPAARR